MKSYRAAFHLWFLIGLGGVASITVGVFFLLFMELNGELKGMIALCFVGGPYVFYKAIKIYINTIDIYDKSISFSGKMIMF